MFRSKITIISGLSLLLFLIILFANNCSKPTKATPIQAKNIDAQMAISNTDQYVWEKMARAFQVKTNDPVNLDWELWATTEYAYSDSCNGVEWPTKVFHQPLGNMSPKMVDFIDNLNNHPGNFNITSFASLTLNASNPYYEELRINKAMFDYIQDNQLYNQNQVYKMAKNGRIDFPVDAMMVKAQWIPIDSSQTNSYYSKRISILVKTFSYDSTATNNQDKITSTYRVAKDTLMGLVGFHLVTHELPNWVWSTFEYEGNEGLCDYIGCKDNFGCIPSSVPANKIINQGYDTKPSSALVTLLEEFGVPKQLQNYRLKGSQTEYTDTKGTAIILGNSILEMNLVETSSCISCHARAAFNNIPVDGDPLHRTQMDMFLPNSFDSSLTLHNSPTETKGFHPLCYTGTPIPEDYLNADSTGMVDSNAIFYQTDFLWQLAQHAKPCQDD